MENSILGIPTQDPILLDIFKYDIQYTHITGEVNLCVNRCGQEIESCDEIHFINMTNNGKVMTLNPNPSKTSNSKCMIRKAFDEDGESMNQYKFEKMFVMTPSYHKIDTVIYDAEFGMIFSKFDKFKKKKYMVLSVLANNRVDVDPKSLGSSGDLLFYKLTNELFGDPSKVPTLFSKKEINYPPNPVRLGDFIPPVGERSFYEYSYNYASNVTYRVFQRPMVISAPVLKNLQDKLTPDKLYQQFKQALSQYENPKRGLVIFFKHDTEKATGKKEGFEDDFSDQSARQRRAKIDGGDGDHQIVKRIEEVVKKDDDESTEKKTGNAEVYPTDFDDDGSEGKKGTGKGEKGVEGYENSSGDEPIAPDAEYPADVDPDLEDGTPLAALVQMTRPDYDRETDPDLMEAAAADKAKEAKKSKDTEKLVEGADGTTVNKVDVSSEGKDALVLFVISMMAIIFIVIFQVFFSVLINNPEKDYRPDQTLMKYLVKNNSSSYLYFMTKIAIYLILAIVIILYLSAVGLGTKYDYSNAILMENKDFKNIMVAIGSFLIIMLVVIGINIGSRMKLSAKYYEKVSVLDSFLNLDSIMLWLNARRKGEGSVEDGCLEEDKDEFTLSANSPIKVPGGMDQVPYEKEDNNWALNRASMLSWSWSKFVTIISFSVFIIMAFLLPINGLAKFKMSTNKTGGKPSDIANLFLAVIYIMVIGVMITIWLPVGSILNVKSTVKRLFGPKRTLESSGNYQSDDNWLIDYDNAHRTAENPPIQDMEMLLSYRQRVEQINEITNSNSIWFAYLILLVLCAVGMGITFSKKSGSILKANSSNTFRKGNQVMFSMLIVLVGLPTLGYTIQMIFSKFNWVGLKPYSDQFNGYLKNINALINRLNPPEQGPGNAAPVTQLSLTQSSQPTSLDALIDTSLNPTRESAQPAQPAQQPQPNPSV